MPFARSTLAALLVLATASAARADDADPVVVRVGQLTMSVSDVSRRLAAIPPFQRATLGRDQAEARRRFVDTVLVPEMLYGAEINERRLAGSASVRRQLNDALRRALVESMRRDAATEGVPAAEVAAYFAAHRDDYQRPERIRIFRILVDDEALARRILAEASGSGGPDRWSRLAREHSVDAATKLRSGALGFVLPDGRTDVPQLTVDPALYAAAASLKDGEIAAAPIHEGTHLAVVWRRGTLPKVDRSLVSEHDAITALLVRQRLDAAVAALVAQRRTTGVTDENVALLDALPPDAPVPPSREKLHGASRAVSPSPSATDRGLR